MLAPSSFQRWRDWVGMATPTSTSAARAAVAERASTRVNRIKIAFFIIKLTLLFLCAGAKGAPSLFEAPGVPRGGSPPLPRVGGKSGRFF